LESLYFPFSFETSPPPASSMAAMNIGSSVNIASSFREQLNLQLDTARAGARLPQSILEMFMDGIGEGRANKSYNDSAAQSIYTQWYDKLLSCKDLLPRIYAEISLLSFIFPTHHNNNDTPLSWKTKPNKLEQTLRRIIHMIHGLNGDVLVGAYARSYLAFILWDNSCRMKKEMDAPLNNDTERTKSQKEEHMFHSYATFQQKKKLMEIIHSICTQLVLDQLVYFSTISSSSSLLSTKLQRLNMTLQEYIRILLPSMDMMIRAVVLSAFMLDSMSSQDDNDNDEEKYQHASVTRMKRRKRIEPTTFYTIMSYYKNYCNKIEILHLLLRYFSAEVYSDEVNVTVDLIRFGGDRGKISMEYNNSNDGMKQQQQFEDRMAINDGMLHHRCSVEDKAVGNEDYFVGVGGVSGGDRCDDGNTTSDTMECNFNQQEERKVYVSNISKKDATKTILVPIDIIVVEEHISIYATLAKRLYSSPPPFELLKKMFFEIWRKDVPHYRKTSCPCGDDNNGGMSSSAFISITSCASAWLDLLLLPSIRRQNQGYCLLSRNNTKGSYNEKKNERDCRDKKEGEEKNDYKESMIFTLLQEFASVIVKSDDISTTIHVNGTILRNKVNQGEHSYDGLSSDLHNMLYTLFRQFGETISLLTAGAANFLMTNISVTHLDESDYLDSILVTRNILCTNVVVPLFIKLCNIDPQKAMIACEMFLEYFLCEDTCTMKNKSVRDENYKMKGNHVLQQGTSVPTKWTQEQKFFNQLYRQLDELLLDLLKILHDIVIVPFYHRHNLNDDDIGGKNQAFRWRSSEGRDGPSFLSLSQASATTTPQDGNEKSTLAKYISISLICTSYIQKKVAKNIYRHDDNGNNSCNIGNTEDILSFLIKQLELLRSLSVVFDRIREVKVEVVILTCTLISIARKYECYSLSSNKNIGSDSIQLYRVASFIKSCISFCKKCITYFIEENNVENGDQEGGKAVSFSEQQATIYLLSSLCASACISINLESEAMSFIETAITLVSLQLKGVNKSIQKKLVYQLQPHPINNTTSTQSCSNQQELTKSKNDRLILSLTHVLGVLEYAAVVSSTPSTTNEHNPICLLEVFFNHLVRNEWDLSPDKVATFYIQILGVCRSFSALFQQNQSHDCMAKIGNLSTKVVSAFIYHFSRLTEHNFDIPRVQLAEILIQAVNEILMLLNFNDRETQILGSQVFNTCLSYKDCFNTSEYLWLQGARKTFNFS